MRCSHIWILSVLCLSSSVHAQSNIDPVHKFCWGENFGWTNWRDANNSGDGVIVGTDFLQGFIWGENVGWINVGDGTPTNGIAYGNINGLDFGVNIGLDDDLGGLAWGENVGWINFGWGDAGNDPNRARFDFGAGRFRGYAWGENTGWINLDDSTHFVSIQSGVPEAPIADATDLDKTRFISFEILAATAAAGGASETALRVHLISLHHVSPPYTGGPSMPFTSLEGQVRWVGPASQYLESSASPVPFYASQLRCSPYYHDWSTVGLLHVTGSAIVPSSVYEVENVASSCQGNEANCTVVSSPLTVSTTRWGDVETPYNPPSPTTQPDLADVSALVNKFRNAPGAPIKARALMVGGDAIGTIDIATEFSFIHIAACVDAFRGRPYPHTIEACP